MILLGFRILATECRTIDPWLSVELVESFAQSVPDVEIIKLNNVGHYPQEHYHEVILQDLLAFVRLTSTQGQKS